MLTVEDCGADLSNAKDYHIRHKVCQLHSKASEALVGNVTILVGFPKSSLCLLEFIDFNDIHSIPHYGFLNSGLRIIDGSVLKLDACKNYGKLSYLQRPCKPWWSPWDKNISGLLHESQNLLNNGSFTGNSEVVSALLSNSPQGASRSIQKNLPVTTPEVPRRGICVEDARDQNLQTRAFLNPSINYAPSYSEAKDSIAGRNRLNNFDLNDAYVDSDDHIEDLARPPVSLAQRTTIECPVWVQQDYHP
ncbi:Cysteine desulfurase mitochondrial [Sarracenia purpurea var. burkii]